MKSVIRTQPKYQQRIKRLYVFLFLCAVFPNSLAADAVRAQVNSSARIETQLQFYDCTRPDRQLSHHYIQFLSGRLNEWIVHTSVEDNHTQVMCVEVIQPSRRTLNRDEAIDLITVSSTALSTGTDSLAATIKERASRLLRTATPSKDDFRPADVFADTVGVVATHFGPNDTVACTGILISPDTVLTAGRCVYDEDRGGYAPSGEFYPGRHMPLAALWEVEPKNAHSMAPGASFSISQVTDSDSDAMALDDHANDIAIMRLAHPIEGRKTYLPLKISGSSDATNCCQTYGYEASVAGRTIRVAAESDLLDVAFGDIGSNESVAFSGVIKTPSEGSPIFVGAAAGPDFENADVIGVMTGNRVGTLLTKQSVKILSEIIGSPNTVQRRSLGPGVRQLGP